MKRSILWFLVLVFLLGALPLQGNCADRKSELFFVAQKAFDDGFYDVAIRYLNQYAEQFPASEKYAQARLLLGQCYFFKNQYLKAFELFQQVLESGRIQDAALFWMGETYFKGADFVQAAEYYQRIMTEYPESTYVPQAAYSLGWTSLEQGQQEEAAEYFLLVTRRYPEHTLAEEALFKAGESYFETAQYDRAAAVFQRYIERYFADLPRPRALIFLAESYYYQNQYIEAVTYYAKAAEAADGAEMRMNAAVGMAWSYYHLQKYDLALNHFERSLRIGEEHDLRPEDAYLGMANTLYAQQKYDEALRSYQEFMDLSPEQSSRKDEARLGMAHTYYALEKFSEAAEGYQKIVSDGTPQDGETPPEIWFKASYGLAWTYIRQGRTEQAVTVFEEVERLAGTALESANALMQMGDAYQEAGSLAGALAAYDKILTEYPESPFADYAQFQQGVVLLKKGDQEAARFSLHALKNNFPQSRYIPEADYYIGLAHFHSRNWGNVVKYIDQFLKTAANASGLEGQARYILGVSLMRLERYDRALKLFRSLASEPSDQAWVTQTAELNIAKCLYRMGRVKEALRRFERIMTDFQGTDVHQTALIWLGDYFFEDNQYEKAAEYYTRFLDIFPGSDRSDLVLYDLGRVYQRQGDLQSALRSFNAVSEENKDISARAKLAVAEIFSQQVDTETALKTYRRIAEDIPDYKRDALLKIAEIARDERDYQASLQAYQSALDADKRSSHIPDEQLLFLIAENYESMRQWSSAIDHYMKAGYLARARAPWKVRAYLRAARIFQDQDQWSEAMALYDKVAAMEVDESKYAVEQLEEIRRQYPDVKPAE
ncbi:MAG: tetratricopeptide repeat protein [Candidatus Omnitrophota bacterium]